MLTSLNCTLLKDPQNYALSCGNNPPIIANGHLGAYSRRNRTVIDPKNDDNHDYGWSFGKKTHGFCRRAAGTSSQD